MIFIIKPVGLIIQFVFDPVIEELRLILHAEPMLTIIHYRKACMMRLSKTCNCIGGCHIVRTPKENNGQNVPA